MPSPESPANRMTTRSSCWTFLAMSLATWNLLAGGSRLRVSNFVVAGPLDASYHFERTSAAPNRRVLRPTDGNTKDRRSWFEVDSISGCFHPVHLDRTA